MYYSSLVLKGRIVISIVRKLKLVVFRSEELYNISCTCSCFCMQSHIIILTFDWTIWLFLVTTFILVIIVKNLSKLNIISYTRTVYMYYQEPNQKKFHHLIWLISAISAWCMGELGLGYEVLASPDPPSHIKEMSFTLKACIITGATCLT